MGICASKQPAVDRSSKTEAVLQKQATKQRELSIDSAAGKHTYGVVQAPSGDSPVTNGTDEHLMVSTPSIDLHPQDFAQVEFMEYLGISNMQDLVFTTLWVGLKEDKRDTCKYWEGQVYRVKGGAVRMFFDNEEPQDFAINALQRLWNESLLFASEGELRQARPGAAVRRLRKSLKGKVPVRQTVLTESPSRTEKKATHDDLSDTHYMQSSDTMRFRVSADYGMHSVPTRVA